MVSLINQIAGYGSTEENFSGTPVVTSFIGRALAAKKIAIQYNDKDLERKLLNYLKMQQKIEKCFDHDVEAYGMSQENKNLNASEFLLITWNACVIQNEEKNT